MLNLLVSKEHRVNSPHGAAAFLHAKGQRIALDKQGITGCELFFYVAKVVFFFLFLIVLFDWDTSLLNVQRRILQYQKMLHNGINNICPKDVR